MKFKGKALVFGDNLNTDDIIPARYLYSSDPVELAQYLMEDKRSGFGQRSDLGGSIIVAGDNFGCGSSREHAPAAIQAAGISCVVAKSFARIFYRNSINIGFPVIELPSSHKIREDDLLEVDFSAGCVLNLTQDMQSGFHAYPQELQEIFFAGGLLEYMKNQNTPAISHYLREVAQFSYKIENIRF